MGQLAPTIPPARRRRAPFVFGGLLIAAAGVATFIYASRLGKEKTDDAQVEAHVSNIAARVAGQVKRVMVVDNQEVKAGDLLIELDDRDQLVRQIAARADLAASNAQLRMAQTQLALTDKTAKANLAVAQGAIAQAALDRATLELEYTRVRAAIAGTVTKRNVEPGQLVSPDRALMAIVDLSDTWVVANLKETQLAEIKPGQAAEISIDSYGAGLRGHVDSIAAGTGSRFSLLPPENASGNFIKVTQRVPVKIKLDDRRGHLLRPGMSAEVTIRTR